MTVSVSHILNQFTSLYTATYVFDFPIKAQTDIEVEFYDSNNDVWSFLALDIDYNVALTLDSITLLDPSRFYGSLNKLSIKRVRPYLQNTIYIPGDKFPARATEGALDDTVMMIQQLVHKSTRALRISDREMSIGEIPGISERAEKYLFFDSSGNVLMSGGGEPDAPRSVLRQDVLAIAGQTVFTTNSPYTPGSNNLLVFVNGLAQVPGVDYLETNENTVTFLSPMGAGFSVLFLFGLILDAKTTIYYIRAINGTALKNGIGELTLEARRITNGVDSLLVDGSIQLYVGTTAVTDLNGYVTGSNGYTGIFNEGDINGNVNVSLQDGPYGTSLYTLTLIDVFDGADTALYYIKPLSGTAIKNGLGTLTVEAHRLINGTDETILSGAIQLYVGTTLVSQTNGYVAGSNGYTGVFDAGDINNSVVVSLRNGPTGEVKDTITLVDIADGTTGGPGTNGVYGYIEVNGSLGHTRAPDQTTWSPVSATTQLDCTFVQAGVAVARVAWLVTRDANGTFTGASVTHKDGDLNGSRVTVIERQEGTASFTIEFAYSYLGDESAVAESVSSSVSGGEGAPGDPASLYYIKALTGTAIKNGTGTLTVEAHRVDGGLDTHLSTGTIKLYVGDTEVTVANGFAVGSNGYTGVLDSGDINGATIVILKNTPAGATLDTITLVDVDDGANGVAGVVGYIEPSGPLAWTRASDLSTWTPSAITNVLHCTFVQGGVAVARVAAYVTRDATGIITGAPAIAHKDGDLNTGRVTISQSGSGSQVISVGFAYSYNSEAFFVSETLMTSMAGGQGTPGTGTPGTPAVEIQLTKRSMQVMCYQNGGTVQSSLDQAFGNLAVFSGGVDITASVTLQISAYSGCIGTINNVQNSPVNGQPKGFYRITSLSAENATLTIQAIYAGVTYTQIVTIVRSYVGYEIVSSLPGTNLFNGRMVYLTGDGKLYRYVNGWTRAVDGADLLVNSVTSNSIQTGAITAAKISVTELSAVSANLGDVTAGVIRSYAPNYENSYFRINLATAKIILDTNPGYAGGYVRIQGFMFGPSGNYIDWYGPKPLGATTEAQIFAGLYDQNALYFMKSDGSQQSVSRIRGEFEPKAWCRFAYSGGVVIQDRFNIASVVRTAQGRFTIAFQSALANANYAAVVTGSNTGAAINTPTTSGFNCTSSTAGGDYIDPSYFAVIVFGSNVIGGSNATTPTGGYGGGTYGKGNTP